MATKYQATDSRGQVHKRTTANRKYTHCIVTHHQAYDMGDGRAWPARSASSWAGSEALARKEASARRSRYSRIDGVEVIPAVEVAR